MWVRAEALYVLLFIATHISALKLPSYIKACKVNDPKLNECVLRNGRQAIPKFLNGDLKYKVPRLDPLAIDELRVEQGSKTLGLTLTLRDAKVFGLRDAKFVAARTNLKKRHVEWDFYHPYLTIVGKYNMTGRVLVLPIKGQGTANITLTTTMSVFSFDYELEKRKDGEIYMKVTRSKVRAHIGRSYFRFNNLFNGDILLGETVNRFLNENNREVVRELGAPVIDSIADMFKLILNSITELVPYNSIYLPP